MHRERAGPFPCLVPRRVSVSSSFWGPLSPARFLQQSLRNKTLGMSDYKIALLCNAYSTNSECFTLPMGVLVETIYGNGSMKINLPGTNCMASGSVTPLPMNLLDSLTVHAKMR